MTKEPVLDLNALAREMAEFARDRDWEQFHSPKNLAMALSVEASELLEIFQWLTEAQSHALDEQQAEAAADEMADVLIYLARLAGVLNIDLQSAVRNKQAKNAAKYPADLVRGSAKKYTEY